MSGVADYDALAAVYRTEARRVLATLIRLLGSFDAAEEGLQEALMAAAEQWPRNGIPENPYAWLVSAGRFKMVGRWRQQSRLAGVLPELAMLADPAMEPDIPEQIQDDELRLIFICCHPLLGSDASIALTLREVAGLTTEEIARTYLVSAPTIAQRIVRAKNKIRDLAIPYDVPSRSELPMRLQNALRVVYLIFNEGYVATEGPSLTRGDLCAAAIRLGRLLVELLGEPESLGLMALMLLHEARRAARTDAAGDIVLLEDQDRSLWDRAGIGEAVALLRRACARTYPGYYTLQAAILAVHVEAPTFAQTDWQRIVALYDSLCRLAPTPVTALNRAIALGMYKGYAVGLTAVEAVMASGELDRYHLAHAARADMLRRLGRNQAAEAFYQRALALTRQPAERRFLHARIRHLHASNSPSINQDCS